MSRLPQVDGVFAHMMPIYSVLAGPWCKLFRKKLIQWYTHKSVDFKLKLANIAVDNFATASKESFRLKTKKPVRILGHGIDITHFAPQNEQSQKSCLAGRQAKVKSQKSSFWHSPGLNL